MSNRYIQRYRLPDSIRSAGCPVALEAAVLLDDTKIKRQVAQLKFRAEDARMVTCVAVQVACYNEQNVPCGTVLFEYRDLAAEQGQNFGTYTAIPIPGGNMARIGVTVSAVTLADGTVWTPATASMWGTAAASAAKPAPRPKVAAPEVKPAEPAAIKNAPKPAKETPMPGVVAKKTSGRKRIVIAAVAVVVVAAIAAAIFLLPKGGGNSGSGSGLADKLGQIADKGSAKSEPVEVPVVTTPSDYGTATLILEENAEGTYCRISNDMIQTAVPQALDFTSYDCWSLGDDIDTYLSFSNHMMTMIYEERDELDSGGWNNIWLDISGYYTVLLFSDPTTLCGYFIGRPESLGDGKWELTFNLCDYDFEDFYRQRKASFETSGMLDLRFIKPGDVNNCGAEYFCFGYGSNGSWCGTYTEQLYYLWSQYDSPHRENYLKKMDTLEKRLPTVEEPFNRYFLLLDKNEEIIGFTLFTPQWLAGPDDSGSTTWDGKIASGFGGGSGVKQDPFIIKTTQQLAYMAQCLNDEERNNVGAMHFRLDADLNLNGHEWTPIAATDRSFQGYFDGNGHTIRGLKITQGTGWTYDDGWQSVTAGLFGNTYRAVIENLTVEGSISVVQTDPNFRGSFHVGGILGNGGSETILRNCHNLCKIVVENYSEGDGSVQVGGVTGQNGNRSTMDGCSNSGEILLLSSEYGAAGGLSGSGYEDTVINCWNTGSVTLEILSENTGGSCGGVTGHGYNTVIANCCNIGKITSSVQVGGITSSLYTSDDAEQNSMMLNCFSAGEVSYTGPNSSWKPFGALVYGVNENTCVSHCFYPDSGIKAIGGSNEGSIVEDLTVFDEVGNITPFVEHVQDALNEWVEANNQDDMYVRWAIVPKYASEFPVPFVD